jgi:hypothetical protein
MTKDEKDVTAFAAKFADHLVRKEKRETCTHCGEAEHTELMLTEPDGDETCEYWLCNACGREFILWKDGGEARDSPS